MNKNGFNRTFVFRSYVHHSNHVPSNGAFTTRFTWLNAYLPKSSSRDMDPRPEYANPFQFGIHLNSCLSKSVNGIDRFGLVYIYIYIYIYIYKCLWMSNVWFRNANMFFVVLVKKNESFVNQHRRYAFQAR